MVCLGIIIIIIMLAHSLYVELQISTNVTQTMVVVNRIATTMKALLIAVVTQDLP